MNEQQYWEQFQSAMNLLLGPAGIAFIIFFLFKVANKKNEDGSPANFIAKWSNGLKLFGLFVVCEVWTLLAILNVSDAPNPITYKWALFVFMSGVGVFIGNQLIYALLVLVFPEVADIIAFLRTGEVPVGSTTQFAKRARSNGSLLSGVRGESNKKLAEGQG